MHFPLFIAKRLYSEQGDKRKVSRPAIHIATAGVAIGLAVMIISVCVVLGFKHTIRDKVIGFGSHIQVADFLTLQQMEQYPIVIDDSMIDVLKHIPDVAHVQRFAMKEGILKTDSDFPGRSIQGSGSRVRLHLHPQQHGGGKHSSFLRQRESQQDCCLSVDGRQTAPEVRTAHLCLFLRQQRCTHAKVYHCGHLPDQPEEIRRDHRLHRPLYGRQTQRMGKRPASGAELSVNNFDNLDMVESRVISKVKGTVDHYGETYSSATIKELNPQIFQWLDLMDLNVWIILALMLIVAGVTMISGLLIIIPERTSMIGILKALGARNKTIRHTFMWFAVFIIGKGMLIGNVLSLGILALQQAFGIIKLDAQTYYVSTVPVEINALYIVALNVATLLISVFMLVAPSYLISHIHPAKSMRYE